MLDFWAHIRLFIVMKILVCSRFYHELFLFVWDINISLVIMITFAMNKLCVLIVCLLFVGTVAEKQGTVSSPSVTADPSSSTSTAGYYGY